MPIIHNISLANRNIDLSQISYNTQKYVININIKYKIYNKLCYFLKKIFIFIGIIAHASKTHTNHSHHKRVHSSDFIHKRERKYFWKNPK